METIFDVFFRRRPADMLIALRNNGNQRYASNLAKETDCTYSHVCKILGAMEKANIIKTVKQGRIKSISLTEKGVEIAERMASVKSIL